MNLLILDAGHAKDTKGKNNASQNFYEWEFNNDMQYKIKSRCEELGITVFLTNPNPSTVSDIALTTRANLANDYWLRNSKPKSIFISLHANAFSSDTARGTETYIAKNASTTSKNFAKVLNDNIVNTMKQIDSGAKDRGVKTENFTVIYKAAMPSVLVEYGFYTNLNDLKILKNNRDELVEATVKAICDYFGVAYKVDTNKNTTSENIFYRVVAGSYSNRSNAEAQVNLLKAKGISNAFIDVYKK
jgi:N-acetylmuramoyl-L-alanine amidase